MEHRHLVECNYSLPSVDDVISRGVWIDWLEMRQKALVDEKILNNIERICLHYISDPYAQRYHFWINFVKKHKKTS